MLPVCRPVDTSENTKVFALPSVVGLTEWVDYIPVQPVSLSNENAFRTHVDGYERVNSLTSDSGLTPFVDYIPVFLVTGRTAAWEASANGYIPVYAAVGSIDAIAQPSSFSNVKLLLLFDGTDGQTTFDDLSDSNHTVLGVNAVAQDTAQFKFGSSSLECPGTTNKYIDMGSNFDDDMVDGTDAALVWEAFVRPTVNAGIETIFGCRGNQGGYNLYIENGVMRIQAYNAGTLVAYAVGSTALVTAEWYHVCMWREPGGIWRLFIDGVHEVSDTESAQYSITIPVSSNTVGFDPASPAREFTGWIDQVRCVRGDLFYGTGTTGFEVPTAAHPTS